MFRYVIWLMFVTDVSEVKVHFFQMDVQFVQHDLLKNIILSPIELPFHFC